MRRIWIYELLLFLLATSVAFIHLEQSRGLANAQLVWEIIPVDVGITASTGSTNNIGRLGQSQAFSFARSLEAKLARPVDHDILLDDQQADGQISLTAHVVAEGETLGAIATTFDTSVSTLQELNAIYDPNSLFVGERLIVTPGFTGSDAVRKSIEQAGFVRQVIGESAGGYPIESFQMGNGHNQIVLIGAIHGGYEWNTALLAYRLLLYFSAQSELVPSNVTLHIVPVANPDGMYATTGSTGPFVVTDVSGDTTMGRTNSNGVDLNRNWGCDWSSVAIWQQTVVSGGTRPFSEPETSALQGYINNVDPDVVIWLHSAAGLLVPGNCQDVFHESSWRAASIYGAAAGYPIGEFTAYPVSGDAANWLAQHKIASFTVELTDHQHLDFERNLDGLLALLTGVENLSEE
jgi:hypothetical protein